MKQIFTRRTFHLCDRISSMAPAPGLEMALGFAWRPPWPPGKSWQFS